MTIELVPLCTVTITLAEPIVLPDTPTGGPDRATVYSAPLFSTGDPRYAWLNKIQVVAKGTLDGQTLTYEMAEVR
jgi:Protein of unknown function (DUF3237)